MNSGFLCCFHRLGILLGVVTQLSFSTPILAMDCPLFLKRALGRASPIEVFEGLAPGLSFDELQKIVQKTLERFPPEKYFFLGLGGSPFPITDYIEILHPGSTGTLPLSYKLRTKGYRWKKWVNRNLVGGLFQGLRDSVWESFSEPQSKLYFPKEGKDGLFRTVPTPLKPDELVRFLNDYIPSEEVLRGRKIVITDFSDWGTSLQFLAADLRYFFEKQNRINDLAFEALFFTQREIHTHLDETLNIERDWIFRKWNIAEIPPYETFFLTELTPALREVLDSEMLKPYRPYEYFAPDPLLPWGRPKKNPAHQKFFDRLKKAIQDS